MRLSKTGDTRPTDKQNKTNSYFTNANDPPDRSRAEKYNPANDRSRADKYNTTNDPLDQYRTDRYNPTHSDTTFKSSIPDNPRANMIQLPHSNRSVKNEDSEKGQNFANNRPTYSYFDQNNPANQVNSDRDMLRAGVSAQGYGQNYPNTNNQGMGKNPGRPDYGRVAFQSAQNLDAANNRNPNNQSYGNMPGQMDFDRRQRSPANRKGYDNSRFDNHNF